MGRGSSLRPSGSSQTIFNLNYNFDIFAFREDGETPTTFNNAVENFVGSYSQSNDDPPEFSFFQGGTSITLGESTNPLTLSLNPSFNANPVDENGFDGTARIEYELTGEALTNAGVTELTLFIEDASSADGFQLDSGATLTKADFNLVTGNGNESASIQRIIELGLLGQIDGTVVGGADATSGEFIIRTSTSNVSSGFQVITPNAVDDVFTIQANASIDLDVLGNDDSSITEEDGSVIRIDDVAGNISSVTPASNGSVIQNENGDLLTYTPATGFTGQDTFTYTINNLGLQGTATVTVNVTGVQPPAVDAVNDSASTEENTAVSIDVLANDSGGGTLSSFNSTSASGGSVVQNGNLLEYTPANDFTGEDTFTYTINNNGIQDTATVTVDVTETVAPPPPLLNGDDVISGDNGNNTLLGGEGNNILYGFDGDDFLLTGSGSDNLQGNNGNDTLNAGGGNDIITGGDGNDIIDGGDGNDTIDAGSQDDNVFGGSGDDLINGGNGNDTLNGGAGHDVLVGDGGSDIFVLNAFGGNDTIRDFNFDHDMIGLSDGITFDQITIAQGNGAATIHYQGQTIGSISGGTPSQFDASKFVEI